MADIPRSAKPASEWTRNELRAYRINFQFEDVATFFGVNALPNPTIDPEVLTAPTANHTTTQDSFALLAHLGIAMSTNQQSAVDDFATTLLRRLLFDLRPRVLRSRPKLGLLICGVKCHANPDVCIIDRDRDGIILLVQEDRRSQDNSDPRAELIAKAIAAFQKNNAIRTESGLPTLDDIVMPAIIMKGTTPTFYKIPVSAQLVGAVEQGTYPASETVVKAFDPPLPRPHERWNEGMKPLDNRRIMLQCYEAFRQFVVY